MQIKVKVNTIYHCSLERAFKTPLLCDVSKVHTGYGIMPPVTHCTDDENWGQVGSEKKVYTAKSLTWKTYMKRVLNNIRQMAYNKEPYQYN